MLTVDLHPIFRNNRDIEVALRQAMFQAKATGETTVEIIPGKGSGKLRGRVVAFLNQPHMRKLYERFEIAQGNEGRILVHFASRRD
ncbi:Smr/MutS family protein [Streptomyces sp. NBC_01497]|uniref:Smr/MutS family protein n=1 Tax=Streptomyces sp. NBC_01497 TaxID=2903885 RepID=UPI002E318AE1|nr:Smr/MutS family protein [Streptomyces sp. NBC_01497]